MDPRTSTNPARVVVALERVGTQYPSMLAVEHAACPLGAQAPVTAVHPGHVLQAKVARGEVEVRCTEHHEEGQ